MQSIEAGCRKEHTPFGMSKNLWSSSAAVGFHESRVGREGGGGGQCGGRGMMGAEG